MRNAARCILPIVALVLFNSGSAWAQNIRDPRVAGEPLVKLGDEDQQEDEGLIVFVASTAYNGNFRQYANEPGGKERSPSTPSDPLVVFHQWFAAGGGLARGVEVAEVEGMGRGLVTTGAVANGDLVLRVPLALVLCRETALASASPALRALGGVRDDRDLIALFLLHERAGGNQSPWAPWMVLLPRRVPPCPSTTATRPSPPCRTAPWSSWCKPSGSG